MAPHSAPEPLHTRAKKVFSEALECPPDQRAVYVAGACGQDSVLYHEVISLLENFDQTGIGWDVPVIPAADPMLGRRFGAYKILRRIGSGGMGAVYLAERADDQFRKLVALKAVRP